METAFKFIIGAAMAWCWVEIVAILALMYLNWVNRP